MSEGNLRIWKDVEETTPGYTKTSEFDGRTVTSINGLYMVKCATDLFGPVGEGWGYEIIEERFDKGGPVISKDVFVCDSIMHTIKLELWYLDSEGEKRTVIHFGHTPYVYGTKYGPKTDFDAPKKSMTDAIKKCLSMLGFSADVFLGLFDDMAYVEAAKVKEAVENAENKDDEIARLKKEFGEWALQELKSYAMIPNVPALKNVHKGYLAKISRQCSIIGLNEELAKEKFVYAFNQQMDKLSPDQKMICPECGLEEDGKKDSKCSNCKTKKIPA